MTTLLKWQCMSCKWYVAGNQCIAYPEGIPEKIWSGEHDHTKPFAGDKGLQYEAEGEDTEKAPDGLLFKMNDDDDDREGREAAEPDAERD